MWYPEGGASLSTNSESWVSRGLCGHMPENAPFWKYSPDGFCSFTGKGLLHRIPSSPDSCVTVDLHYYLDLSEPYFFHP